MNFWLNLKFNHKKSIIVAENSVHEIHDVTATCG